MIERRVQEPAFRRRDEIAVIVIDHAPVNALAQPVRAALLAAIESAESDPVVRAIVIHGAGRHFVAGADIREFDHDPRAPLLNDVLLRLEAATKPVIAALHGSVLGGGFELALACHFGRMSRSACRKYVSASCRARAARSACRGSLAPRRRSSAC